MSTRLPSDDPDVDNSELHREVGGDTVATTPMRGMQTKQQRREAGAAALPCCTNPILNQALHRHKYKIHPEFEPQVSGRQFDDDYDESKYASGLASF